MKSKIYAFFRSVQTMFPFLQDFKYDIQFFLRNVLNKANEPDFNLLAEFPKDHSLQFIDIGANRGEASHSMLIKYPNCTIHAFEPNPLVFERIKKRLGRTKNVILHNQGLGNEVTNLPLFVPFYRKWMFDGLASFYEQSAAGWLETRMWNFKKKHQHVKKVNCDIRKLDEYNLAPYFIKIDVQDFEIEVLKGAEKTITEFKPIILLETPGEEIRDHLEKYGYEFYHLEGKNLKKGIRGLNSFALTEDKFAEITNS